VDLLCQSLAGSPELSARIDPGDREPIPLQKKLLMTLRYLAPQETLLELSDRFGVTEYTLLRSKRHVTQAVINNLFSKFIKWPGNAQLSEIAQRFDDMGGYRFPNIVGAIDGSHIQIEKPHDNAKAYYNRK